MSESNPQWYRAKKGSQPGVIPGIGLHDHAVPILPRSPEHEQAILATGLYEEAPTPSKTPEEAPAATEAPTLADAAVAAEGATSPSPKGGKK